MLIKWKAFNRAKKGTIKLQAVVRGRKVRRVDASIKIQQARRRYVAQKRYRMLRSTIITLQCKCRERIAKTMFRELMKEQKDVGKLKENNEKLKEEMASLRAMLSAQAKAGAANLAHEKEIEAKEKEIAVLEKKIADLEKELAAAKTKVEQLEASAKDQESTIAKDKEQIKKLQANPPPQITTRSKSGNFDDPGSPQTHRRRKSGAGDVAGPPPSYVSPEVLADHRANVAKLQEELDIERKFRREADGEIIKLRAKINGVELNDAEVNELLAQKLGSASGFSSGFVSEESSIAGGDDTARYIFVWLAVMLLVVVCAFIALALRRQSVLRAMEQFVTATMIDSSDNNHMSTNSTIFGFCAATSECMLRHNAIESTI
jgi:DNA repair exonuclease SbcCD ATPase subunit